jgi:hypothetical protein
MSQNQIHFTLQGKGGVGKSLISAINAQYFREKNGAVSAFDTDPVNNTLSQYKSFDATLINILTQDNNVDSRAFDELVTLLLESDNLSIVDNGAATFLPLMSYIQDNKVIDLLKANGKSVFIHCVLTGGQAFNDTFQGLSVMLLSRKAPVVVWINEFFGEVKLDGKIFTESDFYLKHKDSIAGVVKLNRGNSDTFAKDMEMMVKNNLTFDEAQHSPLFTLMPRQRLKMIKEALYIQLDKVQFA